MQEELFVCLSARKQAWETFTGKLPLTYSKLFFRTEKYADN